MSGIIERGNDCVKDVPKFLVGHVLNHKFSDKVEGKVSILVEEWRQKTQKLTVLKRVEKSKKNTEKTLGLEKGKTKNQLCKR